MLNPEKKFIGGPTEEEWERVDGAMPKELRKYPEEVMKFLGTFPEFPSVPWQGLEDKKWKEYWCKRFTGKICNVPLMAVPVGKVYPNTYSFQIQWRFSDRKIALCFADWVEKNRPKGCREVKDGSFALNEKKLPHKMNTSLKCLGVYRRKKIVPSMKEYLKRWPVVGRSEHQSAYIWRDILRDDEQAKKMIKWLKEMTI
ncbi:MAG: hypothetical protein PHV34_22290 [Verrucomicrobiae bacterium]|nr:hypothetical protein [Verrucomicrobiae bacterium]